MVADINETGDGFEIIDGDPIQGLGPVNFMVTRGGPKNIFDGTR